MKILVPKHDRDILCCLFNFWLCAGKCLIWRKLLSYWSTEDNYTPLFGKMCAEVHWFHCYKWKLVLESAWTLTEISGNPIVFLLITTINVLALTRTFLRAPERRETIRLRAYLLEALVLNVIENELFTALMPPAPELNQNWTRTEPELQVLQFWCPIY